MPCPCRRGGRYARARAACRVSGAVPSPARRRPLQPAWCAGAARRRARPSAHAAGRSRPCARRGSARGPSRERNGSVGHASGVNRNRLLLLAGAVGVAAALAVLLIVVVRKNASNPTSTSSSTGTTGGAPSESLAGIPQHGDTLGKPTAPATVIVYEDPQCPFCRRWNAETLPTVLRDFVRTGRIKLVYRGVVIIGPNSVQGLRAIYAAANQNKLWNLVDALYARQGAENSGWITGTVILAAAREA